MLRDLAHLLPLLIVVANGLLVLMTDLFAGPGRRGFLGWMTAVSFVLAGAATYWLWKSGDVELTSPYLRGMVEIGPFGLFWTVVVLLTGLLTSLTSVDAIEEAWGTRRGPSGEYYALLSFAAAGMITMGLAADLVVLVIGLELMSLAVYVLTGIVRRSAHGAEAALKYYLMGAVSSALLLYAVALLYGVTGTTNMAAMAAHFQALPGEGSAVAKALGDGGLLPFVALLMMLAAFGFKVAAFPFHMWSPDAYQGAPTPVTGFMAAGVKAASFAAFFKVMLVVFDADIFRAAALPWQSAVVGLSVLTMVVGNLIALSQRDLKRMLAYSGIAHAGYLLIAFLPVEHYALAPDMAEAVATPAAVARYALPSGALFYYLLVYAVANLGAFAALSLLRRDDADTEQLAGLARRRPLVAAALALCLLSLAGIPPTAGFVAKWYLFRDALRVADGAYLWLVIVAVLNSLVSVYYYLRPTVLMYFHRVPDEKPTLLRSTAAYVALAIAALMTLHAGLLPGRYTAASLKAARDTVSPATRAALVGASDAKTDVVGLRGEGEGEGEGE